MSELRLGLLITLTFLIAGCGALFNGATTPVSMNSNPIGAQVLLDGDPVGATPVTIDISVKEEHRVVFRMDGYGDVTCILNRSVGGGWVILDILGGLFPIIIDAATGSWYELSEDTCNVTLPRADEVALPQQLRDRYAGRI
jgi:hypothetical protein